MKHACMDSCCLGLIGHGMFFSDSQINWCDGSAGTEWVQFATERHAPPSKR